MDDGHTDTDWKRWLDQQAPGFLLFARQQTRSEADAQDVVQEALVEAAGRQKSGLVPERALVFATIRRRAIDLARSQARRERRELASVPFPEPWFDPAPEDREQAELIQNAMRKLPEMYREVITLKIWGGLTFAEIAGALDIPQNTAASRYRYGLEELRVLTKGVLI